MVNEEVKPTKSVLRDMQPITTAGYIRQMASKKRDTPLVNKSSPSRYQMAADYIFKDDYEEFE